MDGGSNNSTWLLAKCRVVGMWSLVVGWLKSQRNDHCPRWGTWGRRGVFVSSSFAWEWKILGQGLLLCARSVSEPICRRWLKLKVKKESYKDRPKNGPRTCAGQT